ncbi:hypothetical protein LPJ60_006140 [Coemansia sp. RSA 2675]|nr:hypothetical protein LPJ60_006140 [Coemansia sp. RSA 2675]
MQLQSTAEHWLTLTYPDPATIPTFNILSEALKGRFTNAMVLDKISTELDNLKQAGSITNYANQLQILAARLQLDSNEKLCHKFARSLQTNGCIQLAMHGPPTLAESICLAIRYKLAYMGATAIPTHAAA